LAQTNWTFEILIVQLKYALDIDTSNISLFYNRFLLDPKLKLSNIKFEENKSVMIRYDPSLTKPISALSVRSSIRFPLFLRGPPNCVKLEHLVIYAQTKNSMIVLQFIQFHVVLKHQLNNFLEIKFFNKMDFIFLSCLFSAGEEYLFLADKIDLLPPNIMISLFRFIETQPGYSFSHPDVHDMITIIVGFLFAAAGNEVVKGEGLSLRYLIIPS
jgi:hypothetical protein